jgi:hypothetical protein
LINLSVLSTNVAAPSTRLHPSVSRLGTFDRGIWTGSCVKVAVTIGLFRVNQHNFRCQVDKQTRVNLDLGVNGADFEDTVFKQLCTRRLWGHAYAKSIFFAIPNSNSVSCSGRLMLEMIKCRSCNFLGSTLTEERERKSACFWLSPSSTI